MQKTFQIFPNQRIVTIRFKPTNYTTCHRFDKGIYIKHLCIKATSKTKTYSAVGFNWRARQQKYHHIIRKVIPSSRISTMRHPTTKLIADLRISTDFVFDTIFSYKVFVMLSSDAFIRRQQ